MTSTQERQLESTRIAAWLRDAILDGVRAPGSRLIERDLASEFGVSRVPVRDALKMLVAEGIVELRPHTWAVVREFTDADLADLDEVRAVLEPLVFRLAAERRRPEGLARLQQSLEAEERGAQTGDGTGARRAAADFHEIVTDLAENRLLSDMMKGIRSRLRWALSQHGDLQHITAEHLALFETIEARDGERASVLAAAHVETSRRARASHEEGLRLGGAMADRASV